MVSRPNLVGDSISLPWSTFGLGILLIARMKPPARLERKRTCSQVFAPIVATPLGIESLISMCLIS